MVMEIHPVFLIFDDRSINHEGVKMSLKLKGVHDNERPVFYKIDISEDEIELNTGNVFIKDLIDRIPKAIEYYSLESVIRLGPGGVEDTGRFFVRDLKKFLEDYNNNRLDFCYLSGIFVCPFALLFCSENECYADGRGYEKELVLLLPRYPDDVIEQKNSIMDKVCTVSKYDNAEMLNKYRFFQNIDEAAKIWVNLVRQSPEMMKKIFLKKREEVDNVI